MSEKIYKCAKCQQNAEQDWNRFRDEYTTSYPIRDKDGKIYCWDCYKGKSSCKGCGKSVANIKFPRSGQPEYPHCNGGVSYNCERVSNNVEFICSKKCSEDIFNRKYQAWKDKLSQGWTKCEECINRVNQLIEWFNELSTKNGEWLKEEKHQSRFIKLVPPGKGELCFRKDGKYSCKWDKEVGKPRLKEIQVQAQKYWETLSYEARIKEVIRSRNAKQVAWGGKFEHWTAEQIAAQNEVPSGIRQEFELKNSHRDCSDCHLDRDFQNSGDNNFSVSADRDSSESERQPGEEKDNSEISSVIASVNSDSEMEKLTKQLLTKKLIELKKAGKSPEEIKKEIQELKNELDKLNGKNQPTEEAKPAKNNNKVWAWSGVAVVSILIAGLFYISRKKKKNKQ